MKRFDPRIVFGILLILGGGLALLQTMGLLENATDLFFGGIFALAGLAFLSLLLGGNWWAVFPGAALLGIGVLILLPASVEDLGGMVFLGFIGLSFWVVYLMNRAERWWAIIPAGVLTTLAFVTILPERVGAFEMGGVFFLGIAVTFLLVALLAGMSWAYWPAGVLGIMGLLGIVSLFDIANYVWAVALMAVGAYLLFRYFANR
ncbi:MAG: hypothetical protein HZB19_17050 [Chloroflexi bacterium]|nr:hypothetical protein [Chloroflexota bacterium]